MKTGTCPLCTQLMKGTRTNDGCPFICVEATIGRLHLLSNAPAFGTPSLLKRGSGGVGCFFYVGAIRRVARLKCVDASLGRFYFGPPPVYRTIPIIPLDPSVFHRAKNNGNDLELFCRHVIFLKSIPKCFFRYPRPV